MQPRRRSLLLGAMALANAQAAKPLPPCRVVGSSDPPFRQFEGDQPGGLYYELLQAAAALAGWPLVFSEVPSARALILMESGEADLMMGPLRTPEREVYLRYSRIELPAEDKGVFTRPDAASLERLERLEQLDGLRVGVQRGKRYGPAFDERSGPKRSELRDYDSALQMLALGRLDAVVAPERQARMTIRRLGLELHQQPLRWRGDTPYLTLSRRSPWLWRLAELEHAFDALQQNGTWKRINARY